MGISPKLWGKQAWHFIHMVALNYPESPTEADKENYTDFLYSIPNVLPCPICGSHFIDYMMSNEPNLSSRDSFFSWTIDAHNDVNRRNGKPILSYEEAYQSVMRNANANELDKEKINLRLKSLVALTQRIKKKL